MCLVIDPGTIPAVFDHSHSLHQAFAPILAWIEHGEGTMIIGGTKYGAELARLGKYLPILKELATANKLRHLPGADVDALCRN